MNAAMLEAPSEVAAEPTQEAVIPAVLLDLMGRIEMKPTFASERGLLYSFRGKQAVAKLDGYGDTIKEMEYEVLIKPESVTLKQNTYTSGINYKANKVFRNWKTDRAISLSLKNEKHGHRVLRIYEHITRTKKWRGSFTNSTARHAPVYDFDPREGAPDLFRLEDVTSEYPNLPQVSSSPGHVAGALTVWALYQLMKELDPTHPAFKTRSFVSVAAYPSFQLFPNSAFNVPAIRERLGKSYNLHSEPDVKKFITKVFGPEGIRKDMVKAVVNTTDINALFLAAHLKHLFPLDWLRDFVKSPLEHVIHDHKTIYSEENTEGLVALLAELTLPQRKRLLVEKRAFIPDPTNPNPRDSSYVTRDSIRMFSNLNPEQKAAYRAQIDYTSWDNLHDSLVRVTNTIRNEERGYGYSGGTAIEWKQHSYMQKLHGTAYIVDGEKYEIIAPKTRGVLNTWGNEMHNCIASYYREVQDGRTNVFGVIHNKTLFANVEIATNGNIVQHMKKYNSPAPDEHFTALKAHIKEVNETIRKKEADSKRIQEVMKRRRTIAA